ncbi:hypothetical protein D3C78_1767840 [compost metagenome]
MPLTQKMLFFGSRSTIICRCRGENGMAFWKFRCTFITRLMKCGASSRPSLMSVVAS